MVLLVKLPGGVAICFAAWKKAERYLPEILNNAIMVRIEEDGCVMPINPDPNQSRLTALADIRFIGNYAPQMRRMDELGDRLNAQRREREASAAASALRRMGVPIAAPPEDEEPSA
jgi:hypothetical protein